MIDTKIACQCGNRFKFGMDLVDGRAPEGLVCPTCGSPVTPACNALVDFLSGKEPAPSAAGTRAVKEIKVTCACGARYKFDLELAEREMPSPVTCPGCQADLTPLANEQLRGYVARFAPGLAVAPLAPAPATPSAAPTPAPAPPATPDSTAAAKPAAASTSPPVTDPFGASKSSGPNLPTLDPSKFQPSGPPVKKPVSGPPKSAPGTSPASASRADKAPDKSSAKPPVRSVPAGEPNLALGLVGALLGTAVGAGLWFALMKITGSAASYTAVVVGSLAGLGARLLARGASSQLGGAACVIAVLGTALMVRLAINRDIDRKNAPQVAMQYKATVDQAKAAKAAKTDAELKLIVARTMPNADLEGTRVTDEALQAFKTTQLPKLIALADDTPNQRTEFERAKLAALRPWYPFEDAWQESIGIVGLLAILGGLFAAARIALK